MTDAEIMRRWLKREELGHEAFGQDWRVDEAIRREHLRVVAELKAKLRKKRKK